MSEAEVVTFNLKVVINKEKTRVLFAEVENDFVDVLFSFLILPFGKIIYALDKHYGDKTPHVIGSFNTLYHGLSNLHTKFKFQRYGRKSSFLNPESAYAFPFLDQKYSSDHTSDIYNLHEAYFVVLRVYTQEKASFIICDDLRILPNGNGSLVQTLNNLGVDLAEIDGAETTSVTLGVNEIMDFLKGLLTSGQPLTNIILPASPKSQLRSCILPSVVKSEPATSLPPEEATSKSLYNLKVVYKKSNGKLLFGQAEKDFVSYIANLLTIPLGIVDSHLGGNTCFNKLHHLYQSLGDHINHKYLEETNKVKLMKPKTFTTKYLSMVVNDLANAEGIRMYLLIDDLTVTHLCLPSTVSLLNEMKISSSDIEEVELKIGLEEARSILKASLMSTHALSDALKFMKQRKPKQQN